MEATRGKENRHMRRKRRDDFLDARITQRSIVLFRLAETMLAQGLSLDSRDTPPVQLATYAQGIKPELATLIEVSVELDRELGIKPWQPSALDFTIYAMDPKSYPPHADFHVIAELHRRLVAAAA
jgi:hypothetical protein